MRIIGQTIGKLNGWQRLWLLLSFLYLLGEGAAVLSDWSEVPSGYGVFEGSYAVVKCHDGKPGGLLTEIVCKDAETRYVGNPLNDPESPIEWTEKDKELAVNEKWLELAGRIQSQYPSLKYTISPKEMETRQGSIRDRNIDLLAESALRALGFIVALYVLWVAVVWVREGFRKSQP